MITNYDIDGVADVMGLSFDRDQAPATRSGFAEDAAGFAPQLHAFAANGPQTAPSMEQAIERGLPRHVLRHVAERIAGRDKAKVAALEWGIVPKTTLDRRDALLSPQESERTERMARLFVHARRALGSEEEARAFMIAPHPELENRSPVEVARTDLGTRRAEQVLNALEYGLVL